MKTKLLFVCSACLDRSPAAESLFEGNKKYEAKSAGLSPIAVKPLTIYAIEWADVIFVMNERNEEHKTHLLKMFPEASKKEIVVLDVSNDYCRHDPELEKELRIKLERLGYL